MKRSAQYWSRRRIVWLVVGMVSVVLVVVCFWYTSQRVVPPSISDLQRRSQGALLQQLPADMTPQEIEVFRKTGEVPQRDVEVLPPCEKHSLFCRFGED